MKNTILTSLLLLGAMAGAHGAIVVYESFENTPLNTNSGTGITGNWAGSAGISAGTLDFGDLQAGSGNKAQTAGNAYADIGSSLSGLLADGTSLWFSVIVQTGTDVGTNPDYGFALGDREITGSNNLPLSNTDPESSSALGFTIKQGQLRASSWDHPDAGGSTLTRAPGANNSGNGVTVSTTYLIAGEFVWGATDRINIYNVNSDLTLGSIVSFIDVNFDQSSFDTVSFAAKGSGQPHYWDEIRFGATSSDVLPVPEPSAALLGGLGALALLRRRRA